MQSHPYPFFSEAQTRCMLTEPESPYNTFIESLIQNKGAGLHVRNNFDFLHNRLGTDHRKAFDMV